MAKPNYGFEKRQREAAKRKKKEDKLRAKAERKTDGSQPEGGEAGEAGEPGEPGEESADQQPPAPDTPTP